MSSIALKANEETEAQGTCSVWPSQLTQPGESGPGSMLVPEHCMLRQDQDGRRAGLPWSESRSLGSLWRPQSVLSLSTPQLSTLISGEAK